MISYLNTDLDLTSRHDLTELVAAFAARGVFALHVRHADDGLWHATLETTDQYSEPEPNIAAIVAVAESLPEPHRVSWLACSRREFNVGYECGTPSATVYHALSTGLLARIAAAGASLAFTLYSSNA